MEIVVGILSLACSGFSRERTHRVDTVAHGLNNNRLDARLAVGPAFQIPSWNFADDRGCCTLGNPSADSNSRPILGDWNRATCHWPVARLDGRSRSDVVWDVSAASTVLFCNDLRQLLSLVDQVAVVDSAIAETKEGWNQQSELQREGNRQLPADRHRGHFCDLHTG